MLSRLLVRRFIKDYERTELSEVRGKYGYLSGIVGIVANIVLFAVKLTTGLIINSIAFIGDAFNNLTDAASSLVTIVGFKLAGKPADEEHPFGHGRLEYIAGLIVSFLIILVGYELFKSSVDRIIHPVAVNFSWPAFLIIILAILTKSWLFLFNRFLAKAIDSKALLATSFDSLSDMVATGCIGVALIASLFTTFPLDGYVGIIVALIIFYSGISLTKETISPLLGEVPEQELIIKISRKILSYQKVLGIHDLIVHTYGPGQYMASIHVEISADQDIMEMHEYIDGIERRVAKELGILLTIHMDPLNTDSEEIRQMQEELSEILKEFPEVLSFHDLRIVGKGEKRNFLFDVVVQNGASKEAIKKLRQAITRKVQEKHPYSHCVLTFDQNDMLVNKF
jgi:cation diffusion facilitator family transporter